MTKQLAIDLTVHQLRLTIQLYASVNKGIIMDATSL